MNSIKRVSIGFNSFFLGFSLFRKNPSLLKYIIIPAIINICIFIFSLYLSVMVLPGYFASFFTAGEGIFYWFLAIFSGFVFFVIFTIVAFLLANLINIPFHTFLVEAYYKKAFVWKSTSRTFPEQVQTSIYFLSASIIKSVALIILGIISLVLSFFPIIGVVAIATGLLIIAFDCCDVGLETLEYKLQDRWRFSKKYKFELIGFSLGVALVSLVPGLNFLLLPFMILGASHMVYNLNAREKNDTRKSPSSHS